MANAEEDHQEIAAAIVTKASRAVSFAFTPATKRPRLTDLVARSVRGGVNLASRFGDEDSVDKTDSLVDELGVVAPEEWVEGEDIGFDPTAFAPTNAQWNTLVKTVGGLTQELKGARRALSLLAQESDMLMEGLDDQVTDLRASVGRRPRVLSAHVPSMEL